MNHNPKLKMIQISQCNWVIKSPKGFILQEGITLSNIKQATEYIRNYVSSFTNWDYEVVPMKDKGSKND